MIVIRKEDHRVISSITHDVPDEDIIEAFGSIERFKEILTHMSSYDEPVGDPPTDEEDNTFFEFLGDYETDREDDWWTDRKGGYDVSYEIDDEDDDDE